MPYCGVILRTSVRIARVISSRPIVISFFSSSTSSFGAPSRISALGVSQVELRTSSTSELAETRSRTMESMISSRRDWAPLSEATLSKNLSGSTMRQRAVVSTQINSRPAVGI